MSIEEYKSRLLNIRQQINALAMDMGSTYSTHNEVIERILNIAMNGDFTDIQGDKVKTEKFITVSKTMSQPEYI